MGKKNNNLIEDVVNETLYAEVVHVPKLDVVKEDSITNKNIELPLRNTTKEQKKNWAELVEAMNGEHTERFNEILEQLATSKPLEYIRVYLKLLEFVQPKLVRTDGSAAVVKDNEITVIIKR